MIGFLLGYILGSPSINVTERTEDKPLTRQQLRAVEKKRKHDKTCPNIDRSNSSVREEMDSIFY